MDDKTLHQRMTETINMWYEDEDYDEWWIYQRDYLEARNTIEALQSRIEALEAALREIVKSDTKDEGGWALNYASDTERWYSKFVLGPMGKIAKQALEGSGNG